MTDKETPTRTPSAHSEDDTILPFEVAALDLRGRVVRLGAAVDEILSRHDYPLPVAKLLGEAIALAALFGSALKFDGRFILQTKTDGPVRMLVVDYTTAGNLRACARFDKKRVAAAIEAGEISSGQLLGHGHLAMTIDQGGDMSRYQGLVALEGAGLEEVAHEYFRRSEQIPPASGSRWPRNSARARAVPSIIGARAGCFCNSCRSRPIACAAPTCIPATHRRASTCRRSRTTRPGLKAAP
jgi:molecular chaperone Hsp33